MTIYSCNKQTVLRVRLKKKQYNTKSFDLTYGQPSFNMNKNFTVETRKIFIRSTKTTYEEGNRDNYFISN